MAHAAVVDAHLDSPEPTVMTCMEVWGGNTATERHVTMLGLETWIYSKPYQQADSGGDVHYVSSCATGRITRLLVADVSGHGASVASISGSLRNLMRQYVNRIEQRHFMSELNRDFAAVRHSGGFATAVASSFFSPSAEFIVTNAGHPQPLYYHAATNTWEILDGSDTQPSGPADLPLGVLEEMEYGERRIPSQPGDLLLCYSDALIESKNANGELLGTSGLHALLGELNAAKPAEFIGALLRRIESLSQGNLTDDDVTALLIRPTGRDRIIPIVNRLQAPWRFLWGCLKAIVTFRRLPLPEFTLANLGGSMLDGLDRRNTGKR